MLVIHRRGSYRGGDGMGRYYHGSGMFGEIARALFPDGVKKALSSGAGAAIAHKVVDAVVNGASSAPKQVADTIVKEVASAIAGKTSSKAVNTAIDSIVDKVKSKKRSYPVVQQPHHSEAARSTTAAPPVKRKKINIDSVIDGSGIIYD